MKRLVLPLLMLLATMSIAATTGIAVSHDGSLLGTGSTSSPLKASGTLTTGPLAYPVLSPSSPATLQNDWAPTGISSAIIVRISTTGLTDLTGLSTCASDGRTIILRNVSANTLRLWDQDQRSTTPADRFDLRRDTFSVPPGEAAAFTCLTSDSRWHVSALSYSPAEDNYRSTHGEWVDEFLPRAGVANGANALIFSCNTNGTGALCGATDVAGADGRIGTQQTSSGTTSSGRISLATGTSTFTFTGASYVLQAVFIVPTLSNSTDGYGLLVGFLGSLTGLVQANGCYVLYDERQTTAAPTTGTRPAAGSHTLSCRCSDNSLSTQYPMDGATLDDSGAATAAVTVGAGAWPSTNVLNVIIATRGTSEADFIVNGARACTITTHIPSTSARPVGVGALGLKSVGTTSVNWFSPDYFKISWDLNSTRSP